jgi:hypothetical protein
MKWILGLDLGPRSRGALQFARWVAQATHGTSVTSRAGSFDISLLPSSSLRLICARPTSGTAQSRPSPR